MNTDQATPRPWTRHEIKLGSTRMESEVDRAVVTINSHDALVEACKKAVKYLERVPCEDRKASEVLGDCFQALALAGVKV